MFRRVISEIRRPVVTRLYHVFGSEYLRKWAPPFKIWSPKHENSGPDFGQDVRSDGRTDARAEVRTDRQSKNITLPPDGRLSGHHFQWGKIVTFVAV